MKSFPIFTLILGFTLNVEGQATTENFNSSTNLPPSNLTLQDQGSTSDNFPSLRLVPGHPGLPPPQPISAPHPGNEAFPMPPLYHGDPLQNPAFLAYKAKYPDTLVPTNGEQEEFYARNVQFGVSGFCPIRQVTNAVAVPYGTIIPAYTGKGPWLPGGTTRYLPGRNDQVQESLQYTSTPDSDVLDIIHANVGKRILLVWCGKTGASEPGQEEGLLHDGPKRSAPDWEKLFQIRVRQAGTTDLAVQWQSAPDEAWLGHLRFATQLPGQSVWEPSNPLESPTGGKLDGMAVQRSMGWPEGCHPGAGVWARHHWSQLYSLDPVIAAEYALRDGKFAEAGTIYHWAQGRYDLVIVIHPELDYTDPSTRLSADTQVMRAYALHRECEVLKLCYDASILLAGVPSQPLEPPDLCFIPPQENTHDSPIPIFRDSAILTNIKTAISTSSDWQNPHAVDDSMLPKYTPSPLRIINFVRQQANQQPPASNGDLNPGETVQSPVQLDPIDFFHGLSIAQQEKPLFVLPDSIPGLGGQDGLETCLKEIHAKFPEAIIYYYSQAQCVHVIDDLNQTRKLPSQAFPNHYVTISDAILSGLGDHAEITAVYVLQPWIAEAVNEPASAQPMLRDNLIKRGYFDPAVAESTVEGMDSKGVKLFLVVLRGELSHPGWVDYAIKTGAYAKFKLVRKGARNTYVPED